MRLQPNTAVDVLKSENPSFVKLAKELGEDGVLASRAIITLQINEMLSFFNVGKSMSDTQVAATINLILEDYGLLKPDDFKLCFKKAMKGQYGKVYDRIDGELIFEWLEQYLYEKEKDLEAYWRNENVRLKKESNFKIGQEQHLDENAVPMPDYVKGLIRKKPKQVSIQMPKEHSPQQRLFNGFISQFDVLHLRRRFDSKNGRYIKRYGKVLNVEDYMNYKANQLMIVEDYLNARKNRKLK